VRDLWTGNLAAGDHTASWNGADDAGRSLASGTYYGRLVSGGESQVKAMVLVR